MPLIIGVTGSIATGKSHLCRFVAERWGALHVDADKVVHEMYAPGRAGFGRIVARFGTDVVGADGQIDRGALGAKVFGDAEKMAALRTAIGDIPAEFFRRIAQWRAELAADDVVVLEAVNLIEGEYMRRMDVAWLTACEDGTAIARLMDRNDLSQEEAEQRLASARDWRERAPAADHVFHNDGSLEAFEAEIARVWESTLEQWRAGTLAPPRWRAWRPSQPPPKDADLPPEERRGAEG